MGLPSTFLTPAGFTVEGASAELLEELLATYDRESIARGVPVLDAYAPGIARAEIEDSLAELGLVAPEELIIWWGWHDGRMPGAKPISRIDPIGLSTSIEFYNSESLGDGTDDEWNADWLRIGGDGVNGMAISCHPNSAPPLIRYVDWEYGTNEVGIDQQVVSLCTPVTWWLTAIAEGWREWDALPQYWGYDTSRYPLEWAITQLA
jgi:hypothetical protein